jgi:hypothetical protein
VMEQQPGRKMLGELLGGLGQASLEFRDEVRRDNDALFAIAEILSGDVPDDAIQQIIVIVNSTGRPVTK